MILPVRSLLLAANEVSACTFAVGPPGPGLGLCPAFEHFCLAQGASRAGCVGSSGTASDGTYLSGYTATCIINGVDHVPSVGS